MNSILHNCTHSNDGSISRLTDEQMFGAIFAYIDHLFDTIKPQKTFYMAIDGVAPRAKMNQQRSRRFRTAVEAEKNMKKALANGEPIPKEELFDTNSITPGTEFMHKLTKNLKFFIHQKITNDSRWQDVEVIFSGHEVPGEGEHKIMEYIRTMKAQKDYNPNLRHCIYGLDADLIMLGLSAHDPHFALLREEVTFGRQSSQKTGDLTSQRFFLLHLSLVREYLELEFEELKDEISFDYDFERVLDDFILVMYVIGNDFLPNLPDLHLNKGAFPLLVHSFKEGMKITNGYLNENGTMNLERFGIWLDVLSKFELENFEKVNVDVEWFNKKLENISIEGGRKRERQGKVLLIKQQKKLVGLIKPWILKLFSEGFNVADFLEDDSKIPTLALPTELISSSEINLEFIRKFALDLGLIIIHSKSKDTYVAKLDIDGMTPDESDDELDERLQEVRKTIKRYQSAIVVEDEETIEDQKQTYNEKFMKWKNSYYKEKFGFGYEDHDEMIALTENYIEGLQWVLYYYYKGCPSWPWYYKYHYAPRISDIKMGLNVKINFDKGTPFRPFQQLMAVLPARSMDLIPACLRPLMTDPHSPIIDFYPDDVEIDKNGKTADWELVVKLSFVDQERLISAMEPLLKGLTKEERQRNEFGKDLLFVFNPQIDNMYHSPLPTAFVDLENNHCEEQVFNLPSMEGLTYVSGLCLNALKGKDSLGGFPTLATIPFTAELKNESVVVFNQPSKQESMILSLQNVYEGLTVEQYAKQYCGKIVHTYWPNLRESKVISVVDGVNKYELVKNSQKKTFSVVSSPLEHFEKDEYFKTRLSMVSQYLKTRGVRLPAIEGIVHVKRVNGLVRTSKGAYVKTYAENEEVYPIPVVVESVVHEDSRFQERPPVPIEEEYPVDLEVVFLGSFAYGSPAKIVGHGDDKLTVQVSKISKDQEPRFGLEQLNLESRVVQYYPSGQLLRMLHIPPLFLSKITSTYMIEDDEGRRQNIGITLKYQQKGLKVLGYTRRNDRGWEFSAIAIDLIGKYLGKFPAFFKKLISVAGQQNSIPTLKSLGLSKTELDEIKKYLKSINGELQVVSLESEACSKISISKIESQIIDFVNKPVKYETKGIKGIPRTAVLVPSLSFHALSKQSFKLGERVIYVQSSGLVPVFSKGTVVGIKALGSKNLIQVLFDLPIMSGNDLDGRLKTQRGLTVDSSNLLNITTPQLVYQSRVEKTNKKQGSTKEAQAKAKAKLELIKAKKLQNQKQEESAKHDLLKLIKGDKPQSDAKPEVGEIKHDNAAVQNIFSSVMGNVMRSGIPPPPQQPSAPFVAPAPVPAPAKPQVNQSGSKEIKKILSRPGSKQNGKETHKGKTDEKKQRNGHKKVVKTVPPPL